MKRPVVVVQFASTFFSKDQVSRDINKSCDPFGRVPGHNAPFFYTGYFQAQAWRSTAKYIACVEVDCFDHIYDIYVKLYTCKIFIIYYLVVMSAENKKDDETQTVKPKKRSETDKQKEKEELETLDVESTAGGMGGGGG
jgi:hypothetical protein